MEELETIGKVINTPDESLESEQDKFFTNLARIEAPEILFKYKSLVYNIFSVIAGEVAAENILEYLIESNLTILASMLQVKESLTTIETDFVLIPDKQLAFFVVKHPEVTISNNKQQKMYLGDIYTFINVNNLGVRHVRHQYDYLQLTNEYYHSHINRAPILKYSDLITYLSNGCSMCMGNTLYSNLYSRITNGKFDYNILKLFIFNTRAYLEYESLEGGPYRYIKNIYENALFGSEANFLVDLSIALRCLLSGGLEMTDEANPRLRIVDDTKIARAIYNTPIYYLGFNGKVKHVLGDLSHLDVEGFGSASLPSIDTSTILFTFKDRPIKNEFTTIDTDNIKDIIRKSATSGFTPDVRKTIEEKINKELLFNKTPSQWLDYSIDTYIAVNYPDTKTTRVLEFAENTWYILVHDL